MPRAAERVPGLPATVLAGHRWSRELLPVSEQAWPGAGWWQGALPGGGGRGQESPHSCADVADNFRSLICKGGCWQCHQRVSKQVQEVGTSMQDDGGLVPCKTGFYSVSRTDRFI